MVSFSCESCGDVLTKKKLDSHRNQCYGATYTCIDCMVHFQGTDYRSHTSCISEAQKYEGALYKDKKAGKQQKQNSQANSQALVPRNAYVEDAPDDSRVAVVNAPPHAPSPPPTVNVFDFLVADATPNASKANLPAADERLMLEDAKDHSEPSTALVKTNGRRESHKDTAAYDSQEAFASNGYSYGHTPIAPSFDRYDSYHQYRVYDDDEEDRRLDPPDSYYMTPGPHKYEVRTPRDTEDGDPPSTAPTTAAHTRNNSYSKKTAERERERKRKRNHVEDLDMALVRAQAQAERDAVMTDAPPLLQHSGLTGGLNRLLARPEFPLSPDYSGGDWVDASPISPMKRSKQMHRERERERERERGRDREPKPRKTSGGAVIVHAPGTSRGSGAWVRHRRDRDDSGREHRRHRSERDRHHHRRRRSVSSGSEAARDREREKLEREVGRGQHKPAIKAIEYKPARTPSLEARDDNALVRQEQAVVRRSENGHSSSNGVSAAAGPSGLMQARADLFMSMVTKGPDSERGFSVNKALKRYHRQRQDNWDRGASWGGMSKGEEEKELWKSLRLKKNDRGEIVVFVDL